MNKMINFKSWVNFSVYGVIVTAALQVSAADIAELELSLGPEINVGQFLTSGPLNQYQTNLRTDPTNADQMVITAKAGLEDDTVAFHTNDGGTTWTATRDTRSSDPDVTFDYQGTAYWTFIENTGSRSNAVRRSFDGGQTWGAPQQLVASSVWVDHPHVITDRSDASPYLGSVYFAGRQGSAAKLRVVRSRDGGETWTANVVDLPQQIGKGFVHQTAVASDGTLLIPVESQGRILVENGQFAGSERNLFMLTSSDGGESFSDPIFIGNKDTPRNPGPGSYRSNSGVAIGSYNGIERAYYVFPKPLQGQPAELRLVFSDDLGQTWSDPSAFVPSTSEGWGAGAPTVMINDEGVVGVAFYSETQDPHLFDLYFTASIDGGQSFTDPLRVSSVTSLAAGNQVREPGADQVYSDVAADGTFKLVWTDNRDGDDLYQTYMRSIEVTVIPEPGTLALIAGGAILALGRRRSPVADRVRSGRGGKV